MKFVLLFLLIFSQQSFSSTHNNPDKDDCVYTAFFPPLFSINPPICYSISYTSDMTNGNSNGHSKKAIFIEAAPVATNYLLTGKGLDNPVFVYAMLLARENESDTASVEELSLRIIENANKR